MPPHSFETRRNLRSFTLPRWGCWLMASVAGAVSVNASDTIASADLHFPLPEAVAHGFPALYNAQGQKLADGEFFQTPQGDYLRVKLTYDFGHGHRIEENTVVRQRPALEQEEWTWAETQAGETVRRFAVDFRTGEATAEKWERGERRQWNEKLKIEPGHTFTGFAFALALECLRERLTRGEKLQLRAVGFTPKPRVATVELSYGGLDEITMANRRVTGERFTLHPEIPRIAKIFIAAPDTRIWLISPGPSGFLRWEGTPVESTDAIVWADLLPGERSQAPEPVRDAR